MDQQPELPPQLGPINRLSRDLKKAVATLQPREARYLVDTYYQMQDNRIRANNQIRALTEYNEPHEVVNWLSANTTVLENDIKRALGAYSQSHPVGKWAESIIGIGPVISAGLLANINMEPWFCQTAATNAKKKPCTQLQPCGEACHSYRITTAGKIWRFAGLDPTVEWKEGQKRPWNASLKRLCWIIGESFTKFSSHKDDLYGKLYLERKAREESRNAEGLFEEQAKLALASKRWVRDTKTKAAYEDGHLPQARIHLRAQRHAVKIFLSHWHQVAYFNAFKERAPKPFAQAILGHANMIEVPHWPFGK